MSTIDTDELKYKPNSPPQDTTDNVSPMYYTGGLIC
jgi:hypothetical protein